MKRKEKIENVLLLLYLYALYKRDSLNLPKSSPTSGSRTLGRILSYKKLFGGTAKIFSQILNQVYKLTNFRHVVVVINLSGFLLLRMLWTAQGPFLIAV